MKVLVGLLLTLMLVTLGQTRSFPRPRQWEDGFLGQASSFRRPRQWKDGSQMIDQGHIQVKQTIQEPVQDPDWVPHPDDYIQEEKDDLVKDPTWVPTKDDYAVDEGEYYDYDSYGNIDQDHTQVKQPSQEPVPDPDWVPHPDDYSQEEEEDDLVKDPTWVPTEDDYAVDEGEYYDYDSYEDIEEGEEVVDDEEDKLWTSDDDPDYVPKDEDDEENSSQQEQNHNTDDDPDWIPTEDEYHDDDLYHYDDDVEDEYHDDDYYHYDDDVGHEQDDTSYDDGIRDYDYEDEVARVNEVLLDQDLSYQDALQGMTKIEQESQEPQEPTQQVSAQLTQQRRSVKVKRQTKSQHQVSQFTHGQEVGQGVVPVHPQVGITRDDIASGVEAETEESSGGIFGWLTADNWSNVVDAADKFGDTVGDTFDEWGDKISGAASSAVDNLQGVANTAGESIVSAYHQVSGKIPELRERIKNLFVRFGVLVQTGADYCILHLGQAVNQVKEAEILDKLQQKLSEGNEQVIEFFQVIGQKVETWTQTHGQLNVDGGLIILEPTEGDDGHGIPDIDDRQTQQQAMPNLYQDKEVIVYLNRMVTSGVITQGELEQLSQQQTQQLGHQQIQEQSQQIQEQSQQIQEQSH